MMQVIEIAKKEFISKVKAKSFWWIAFAGPVFLIVMSIVPIGLSLKQKEKLMVEVKCNHPELLDSFLELPMEDGKRYQLVKTDDENAISLFLSGQADALVIVPDSILEVQGKSLSVYTKHGLKEKVLAEIVNDIKTTILMFHDSSLLTLKSNLKIEKINIVNLDQQKQQNEVKFVFGLFFAILIYMFVVGHGVSIIRSLQEEKSSRLFEVILITTKGWKLMLGKVTGVFLAGLSQAAVWLLLSVFVVSFLYQRFELSRFNDKNIENTLLYISDKEQALEMNQIVSAMDSLFLNGGAVYLFVLMMIFGFLLYSSFFIHFGTIQNQHDDLQKVVMLISAPMVISILSLQFVYVSNEHWFSQFLMYFPLTSPLAMVFTYTTGGVGWLGAVVSLTFLMCSAIFSVFVAGKNFSKSMFNFKTE